MTLPWSTLWLTAIALIAFAGNSVLARMALIDGAIGPVTFTAIRLLSGAAMLAGLIGARSAWTARGRGSARRVSGWRVSGRRLSGDWRGAFALLGYAGLFSLAYINLVTGTGALILFASVQITMIGWAVKSGERHSLLQIAGICLAIAGLTALLLPGLSRPDPLAALLMTGSGVAWGIYSLLGRNTDGRASDPAAQTAGNFLRASLIALPLAAAWVWLGGGETVSGQGAALAIASGALTSGLGYAIWYRALKGLSASQAGIVQLLVPPLAALGGIVILDELLTVQFVAASAMILVGIALALAKKRA